MKKLKRLLPVAAILGLAALVFKKQQQHRAEWHGISETAAREKLGERLPNRMPEERRAAVTDKIVGAMRARGVIVDDDTTEDMEDIDVEAEIDLTEQPAGADADITAPST